MGRIPATLLITALIFLTFGYELRIDAAIHPFSLKHVMDMTEDTNVLLHAGAIYSGMNPVAESWRFPASMFIHIGWIHLLLNVLALLQIGFLLEGLFGSALFTFSYLTSGLLAGVGSWLLLTRSDEGAVLAGASGAIFGILGTLIMAMRRSPELRERRWSRGVARQLTGCATANLVGGAVFSIAATLTRSSFNLGMSAHVIGLAAGLLIGFLPVRLRETQVSREIIARFERPRRMEPEEEEPLPPHPDIR
jgi:membrane associated rhomboid family serine protease